MASNTIIVADSNLRYRTLIGTSLELLFSGLRIIKAATRNEAVDKIKRYDPKVTLIDAELLGQYTDDDLRVLRRQYYTSTVILLTDRDEGTSINEDVLDVVDNVVTRQMLLQQLNLAPANELASWMKNPSKKRSEKV